jgi:hypothetical protein
VTANICVSANDLSDLMEDLLEFSKTPCDRQVWKLPRYEPGKFIENIVDPADSDQQNSSLQ